MRTSLLARVLVVVLVVFGLLVRNSHAQSTIAAVSGQITDEQGRVVPGVTVVLTNLNTGVPYEAKTNGDGIYSAPNLPPGIYRANVTKDGFKSIVKGDIELHVQDVASINFRVQVGSVTETVTVEGGAPMVNTTDASVSTVVDQTYIMNMPLNGRSFQDLILLTPGIVTNSPQGGSNGGEFSVNGQRTEANYYSVDGVSANVGAHPGLAGGTYSSGTLAASTALGTTQALVSVDALREFRVQSSTYSAEYGRNPGGQFAFETKSGTNQWHGTAYDYLRNDFFDAADYFTDYFRPLNPALTKPSTRQNDFGGTLGGPVRIPGLYNGTDKTFFFVSYEGLRLLQPQPTVASSVPDLCMRGVATQCPSGRQPAASALLPVMNAFPGPNPNGLEDATNGFGQFIGGWSNPSSIDSTGVRFDHVVNDKVRLFFRFSDTSSSSEARLGGPTKANPPSQNAISAYAIRTYTAGANIVFSSRLSNEVRVNYSSNESSQNQVIDAFGGSKPVDLIHLSSLGAGTDAGLNLLFGEGSTLEQLPESAVQRQWNVVDTVSLSLGRHQFRFGADYRRLAPFGSYPTNLAYYFFSESDVEANNAFTFVQANAPAYPLFRNFSAFAQDEWRVAPRLSVSLGLRWEVNPPPGATRGLMPYTVQGTDPSNWTLAPQGTPLWKTTWYNFAPRLGAAYILRNTPGSETVVRAGGGDRKS